MFEDIVVLPSMAGDAPDSSAAPYPFNKPDADVVLRSTDSVDFHVRSHILLEASPAFERILASQPSAPLNAPIGVNADSKSLDILLRLCYPIRRKPRTPRTMEEIRSALCVAIEYEMELPIEALEDELVDIAARGNALEVWVLARELKSEGLARRAIECTFGTERLVLENLAHRDGITAADILRLREYHRLRGRVDSDFKLLGPPRIATAPTEEDPEFLAVSPIPAFVSPLPHPDLDCVSSDHVEFSVHEQIISNASGYIRQQIAEIEAAQCYTATVTSTKTKKGSKKKRIVRSSSPIAPVMSLPVGSKALASVFSLCYYDQAVDVSLPPSEFLDVLLAAEKLEMPGAVKALQGSWEIVAARDPLRAYFAAACKQLGECATTAAKVVLQNRLDGHYIPEMETTPALAYIRLERYCERCRAAAKQALCDAYGVGTGLAPPVNTGSPQAPEGDTAAGLAADLGTPESNVWLQRYIETLSESGGSSGTVEDILQHASANGNWCPPCAALVQKVACVSDALRSVPIVVSQITLEL
ncbi:hypothetical protein C8Q76DRAFT_801888 [Earliella scabrosa]|nr:hypothetical protein C8Q76DRAFT_801888 [Earliella scabrosa]